MAPAEHPFDMVHKAVAEECEAEEKSADEEYSASEAKNATVTKHGFESRWATSPISQAGFSLEF